MKLLLILIFIVLNFKLGEVLFKVINVFGLDGKIVVVLLLIGDGGKFFLL